MSPEELDECAFEIFKEWHVLDTKIAKTQKEYWDSLEPQLKAPWIKCATNASNYVRALGK